MQHNQEQLKMYYKHGFDWYFNRFFAPKRHRAFVALLLLTAIFFCWLIIKLSLIDIVTERIPFPIYYEDSLNSYSNIKKLTSDYRDINQTIASYLLQNYILLRENYSRKVFEPDNWNKIQKQLQGFSSREIYADYANMISTNNSESPYFLYLRNRTRVVDIRNIVINKANNYAEIYFTATDADSGKVLSRRNFVARVTYFISDAEKVKRGQRDFKFLITNYQLIENNA